MIPFSSPLPAQEEWMSAASCATVDAELFYAENERTATFDAKRVCARCPVADPCLTYALEHQERWGVWAGTTPNERLRMRRGEHVTLWKPREPQPADYTDCAECATPFIAERGTNTCSTNCRRIRAARLKSASDRRKRLKFSEGETA